MSMLNFEQRTQRNLLDRKIELNPGDVQVNQAKEQIANLAGAAFISRVVVDNDTLHKVSVSLETPDGSVAYAYRRRMNKG